MPSRFIYFFLFGNEKNNNSRNRSYPACCWWLSQCISLHVFSMKKQKLMMIIVSKRINIFQTDRPTDYWNPLISFSFLFDGLNLNLIIGAIVNLIEFQKKKKKKNIHFKQSTTRLHPISNSFMNFWFFSDYIMIFFFFFWFRKIACITLLGPHHLRMMRMIGQFSQSGNLFILPLMMMMIMCVCKVDFDLFCRGSLSKYYVNIFYNLFVGWSVGETVYNLKKKKKKKVSLNLGHCCLYVCVRLGWWLWLWLWFIVEWG